MTAVSDKIIVALDVSTKQNALRLVDQLLPKISIFKIGLQLYTAEGPDVVRAVIKAGAKVFLDLKLHDIPNTVACAVESVNGLGVQMLTIHLSGGQEMIRAAVSARRPGLTILGVTVLTSLDKAALAEVGVAGELDQQALRLAKLGVENGVDGIVASAHEIKTLRRQFANRTRIIVPGIRPAGSEAADQKRTMTPREAIEAGADYLVIGRPITAAKNPVEAVSKILQELS